MMSSKPIEFYESLSGLVETMINGFDAIPDHRKAVLDELARYIQEKAGENVKLLFICTHNSRRSHIAQIWAQTAAVFYDVPGIESYSGGTEATAFNPRAVSAMRDAGFNIEISPGTNSSDNPVYEVQFSNSFSSVTVFSKKYDAASNPRKGFIAVMTCSHADENCPLVPGAEKRISLPYDDPKDYDGTAHEKEKYSESVKEIGREILYAFSKVKV